MSEQRVEFPEDFEDYAWEVEAKGWLQGVVVVIDGRRYPLTIYDLTRLAQDVEEEVGSGETFFERNLVVVSSVTREHIEAAVAALVSSGRHLGMKEE